MHPSNFLRKIYKAFARLFNRAVPRGIQDFDNSGDSAVDSNIPNGQTRTEVKQSGRDLEVPGKIIPKIPSADLEAKGESHNDESQLTEWAKKMGFDIKISYGSIDGTAEGNIAWAWNEDTKHGVVTGKHASIDTGELFRHPFDYSVRQIQTILFLRAVEQNTRHKIEPIVGLERNILMREGVVD